MKHQIYIDKFLNYYDPFSALDLDTDLSLDGVEPLVEYQTHLHTCQRDKTYHLRRIRFFVEELRRNDLDPIEIDNQGDTVASMWPVLIDGHHRLIAAILEHQEMIWCTYGGRLDFLEDMMRR
jgi:hypothetical protein